MKRTFPIILLLCVVSLSVGFSQNQFQWREEVGNHAYTDVRFLAFDVDQPELHYQASAGIVFLEDANSRQRQKLFTVDDELSQIADLYVYQNTIYIVTASELLASVDQGKTWERLFIAAEEIRLLTAVYADETGIYLGTTRGLFFKTPTDSSWQLLSREWAEARIYALSGYAGGLALVDEDGLALYSYIDEESVRISINVAYPENITSLLINNESNETLCVLPECLEAYLGTTRGVFYSMIMLDAVGNFARWSSLYKGMDAVRVSDLAQSGDGKIWAVSRNRIYALTGVSGREAKPSSARQPMISGVTDEPKIQDVQQWAIQYAEVHPDKITRWREALKKRAWAPSLNIGIDGGDDRTFSDSVYGTSSGSHYIAPDDKSYSRDFGWDISLSWDLADLIWDSSETTIDNRSKLMVELREDILNQVTRLYFERRRLQLYLLNASGIDSAEQLDQELRVEELTALIDGMTGGEFGKNCNVTSR